MTLRINTNIAALNAHKNLTKNDNALSASLEKLSSGLRINRAADDASGMAIADSLRSQGLGLGQAIRNANDGISMVQTADGALEESINIVNTIKTKAIQAAQDGQTVDSRKAIQADVDKLMAELDMIARTTSFNGQKLLSGQFTDKQFQVGAFTGETVGVDIGSSESNKTGHLTTANLETNAVNGGEVRLSIFSNVKNAEVAIQSVTLAYDNDALHGMGALSDAINKVAGDTGVTAQATVEVESNSAVAAGATATDFAVNGVTIGAVTVQANDNDGSLVNAINQKTDQHGIFASTDEYGKLHLNSTDGRAIQVSGNTDGVLLGSNLSSFGSIKLFQVGANEIKISDEAQVMSLNLTSDFNITGTTTTIVDSTLVTGSVVGSASTFKAGTTIGATFNDAALRNAQDITTTLDSTLLAGSVLGSSSTIEKASILGGRIGIITYATTTEDSVLTTGSILGSSSVLAAGTQVTTEFVANSNTYAVGSTLSSDVTLSDEVTLTSSMQIGANSTFSSSTSFNASSYVGVDITTSNAATTLTQQMTLKAGSIINENGASLAAGSTIGGDFTTSDASVTLTRDMEIKAGSILGDDTNLAKGSTIGGNITLSTADVTVAGDMSITAGSMLAAGTVLRAGTVLANDVIVTGGDLLSAGTVLNGDAILQGSNYMNNSQTLNANSVINSGSVLAAAQTAASGASATTSLSNVEKFTLSDVDVTSQESAQTAISIADSALRNLDKIRSGLGSTQNQLTSTIANVSVTRVNIFAAESSIRDVDFAEESSTFSKMQILMQASTFAMSQANASSQNVLSLLQG